MDMMGMHTLTIPARIVRELRTMRPTTHELGGKLEADEQGTVTGIVKVAGQKCRDETGKLLKDKICQVLQPQSMFVFHTHPRANRPSSQDLKIAITGRPRMNIIVTDLGIWGYVASPQLKQRYASMTPREKRCLILEYRFLGHMEQKGTQENQCYGMIKWMREAGFIVNYYAYGYTGDMRF